MYRLDLRTVEHAASHVAHRGRHSAFFTPFVRLKQKLRSADGKMSKAFREIPINFQHAHMYVWVDTWAWAWGCACVAPALQASEVSTSGNVAFFVLPHLLKPKQSPKYRYAPPPPLASCLPRPVSLQGLSLFFHPCSSLILPPLSTVSPYLNTFYSVALAVWSQGFMWEIPIFPAVFPTWVKIWVNSLSSCHTQVPRLIKPCQFGN